MNFCDALQAMKPSGDQSRLEISVSWADLAALFPECAAGCLISPGVVPVHCRGGQALRFRAFARAEEYRGRLLATEFVQRPFNPDPVGRIIIAAEVAGQPGKIKVDLEAADFRRACDALPDRRQVAVTGIIRNEVKAREYELTEPRDFKVIQDS